MESIRKHRTAFLENWFSLNSVSYFTVICALYFAALFLKRTFIIDNIAAFEVMESRGEMWLFDLFFGLQYFVVPVFLAWKISITSFILWVGSFMYGYRLTYNQLWKMVLIFELIFIIPELLKVLQFLIFQDDPTYADYINSYPLSLISFFNADLNPRWHYPLKALNLFEIAYWVGLTLGIFWLSNKKLHTSGLIVISSYILSFFLWIVYYLMIYR